MKDPGPWRTDEATASPVYHLLRSSGRPRTWQAQTKVLGLPTLIYYGCEGARLVTQDLFL